MIRNIGIRIRSLWYEYCYYNVKTDKQMILLDSRNGKDLGSNLLRIGEELAHNPAYSKYKLYFSCCRDKRGAFKELLDFYDVGYKRVVTEAGFAHYRLLAKCGFLFTDTSFPHEFSRKQDQVIINTWHGTPLKNMGRDEENQAYGMGNVQKGQLAADYLLYPSRYMKEVMTRAYCMEGIYKGRILLGGYPRNGVFFQRGKQGQIRKAHGWENIRIYVYMPTWRGSTKQVRSREQLLQVKSYLEELDASLGEHELCLLRLHPFVAEGIDCRDYRRIRPFPKGPEPCEVLNEADCLITDYSSVFFDFANASKKIILFLYDEEQYKDERGLYLDKEELPFPVVRSVEDLVEELRSPAVCDLKEFRKKYCTWDGPKGAKELCSHVILKDPVLREESLFNGKENLLLYAGDMQPGAILEGLLSFGEREAAYRNVFVTFFGESLREYPERIASIPPCMGIIPMAELKNPCRKGSWEYEIHLGFCSFHEIVWWDQKEESAVRMFCNAPVKKITRIESLRDLVLLSGGENDDKKNGATI